MPEGQIYVEKRKYKRVDKKILVSYKVVSMPAEIEKIKKQAEKNISETVNISIGGIQLINDIQLTAEQIIRIELVLTPGSMPIITFAEVRWCAKDSALGRYRTGIEFLVLKEEDQKLIEEIIE
jgi:c-di-GMP-binding flagellar brake protein YcgR